MRRTAVPAAIAFVVLVACSDRTVLLDVDPRALPEVVVTRPVGSPPVAGTVDIAPRPDEVGLPPWTYEVDLGDDGSVEGSGTLDAAARVAFSFGEPGLHPIRVVLERPNRRASLERSVNVLDPDRVEMVRTARIDPPAGPTELFAGIAVDRAGEAVYVAGTGRVFGLDPATLAVRDALAAPEAAGALRGLAVAPDESLLHVVTASGDVWAIDPEDFATEAFHAGFAPGRRHVEALAGRRAWVGGDGGLGLLDVARGTVLGELALGSEERVEHVALSPSGDRIVAIVLDTSGGGFRRRVVVADAGLVELGRTALTDRFLESVAWSPAGEKLYARYVEKRAGDPDGGLERCGVFVLDAASLEVVEDEPLGVVGGCSSRAARGGLVNPVAASPDGRFLVLPSPGGTYVFDTALDRPIARTPAGDPCCGVAADPVEDAFYLVGPDGSITKLRVAR